MMWMLLLLPEGPSLWQHLVLMFGSKAAVWAYNRFGDGLMYIGRIFLAIMLTHYVDDYNAADPEPWAHSSYDTFIRTCQTLGVNLKESKKQPPSRARDTLGLELTTERSETGKGATLISVKPRESRRQKTIYIIWMSTLNQGAAPWFEHVPSAAQLADAVSRGDTKFADDEGWIDEGSSSNPFGNCYRRRSRREYRHPSQRPRRCRRFATSAGGDTHR